MRREIKISVYDTDGEYNEFDERNATDIETLKHIGYRDEYVRNIIQDDDPRCPGFLTEERRHKWLDPIDDALMSDKGIANLIVRTIRSLAANIQDAENQKEKF